MEDTEIVAFWEEVKTKGHPDLAADAWPELKDIASLRDILTTIAFNGSVHHSAVNFGRSAVRCAVHECWKTKGCWHDAATYRLCASDSIF